ncbi:MAG TPA: CoA ester lyase [Caulobacteraceae bacterium]
MTLTQRPRRSALYMPASNARAVEKARTLPCDVVILDLEDAVATEAKNDARQAAVAAVRAGGFGHREVVVRVNGLETAWGEADLEAMVEVAPDAILVPKIRGPGDVHLYDRAMARAARTTRLWAMIETVQVILQLEAVAATAGGTRLAAMVLGMNDLAREMGARQTADRAAFHFAMSTTVTAARVSGLVALDSVHNEIDDLGALEAVCRQGADFGFDGKSVIHPSHLGICNRIFGPSAEDLVWARAVIEAFDAPENIGKGVLRVHGRLAEALHRDQALRLVGLATAISAAEAASLASGRPPV